MNENKDWSMYAKDQPTYVNLPLIKDFQMEDSDNVMPNPFPITTQDNSNTSLGENMTITTGTLHASKDGFPKKFDINEINQVHHTDPQEYELTIRVDQAGHDLLLEVEGDIEILNEKETLLKQREIINERIEQIDGSLIIL